MKQNRNSVMKMLSRITSPAVRPAPAIAINLDRSCNNCSEQDTCTLYSYLLYSSSPWDFEYAMARDRDCCDPYPLEKQEEPALWDMILN